MHIGKYLVSSRSMVRDDARYVGTAVLIWDEEETTCEQAIHFHKSFATAGEAEQHAIEQVQIRVKDGAL